MADIEDEVFTRVKKALTNKFPQVTVEGVTDYSPSKFPFVCIEEADSYSYLQTRDSGGNETHTVVVYEVNAYSNKSARKKSECKNLIAAVDDVMLQLGFTRNTNTPLNSDVATRYRIFARYTAVVSKSGIIYRR